MGKISGQTGRLCAYDALHKMLLLGKVPAGQRLHEVEWSKLLGVNRTAVRDALGHLYIEGLVIKGEKTGYRVPDFSRGEIEDILEVRQSIEITATARIIRMGRHRRGGLGSLELLCDELEWMLERQYAIDLTEADYLFHRALVELSANRRLVWAHQCLPQVRPKWTGQMPTARDQFLVVLREHRAILSAVRGGNLRLAQSLIKRHISNGRSNGPEDTVTTDSGTRAAATAARSTATLAGRRPCSVRMSRSRRRAAKTARPTRSPGTIQPTAARLRRATGPAGIDKRCPGASRLACNHTHRDDLVGLECQIDPSITNRHLVERPFDHVSTEYFRDRDPWH